MVSQSPIQTVLNDPRWASGIVESKRSNVTVHLQSFPGVVGGEFRALVVDLLPEHMGRAEVTLSCTGSDSGNAFLEVETFQIQDPALEVHFLIPFEAKGSDEGHEWHLQIQFTSGATEVFEVPVCRTYESNPEVSEIEIAAAGLNKKEQWHAARSEERSGSSWEKPYELTKADEELHLNIPSRVSGRPCLAKGLAIFWGIWAAVTALFYWIFEGELEPTVILGIPLIAMSVLLAFALFGVSKIKIGKDQLVQRHSLFGLSIPKRVKRSDISSFDTKCVGSLGDANGSWLVVAEKTNTSCMFLSAALLNKTDARTLVKRLNKFWGIERIY